MVGNISNTQRIDQLEQGLSDLRALIPVEVESAIGRAMVDFQQTIAAQVAGSLDKAVERVGAEFAQLTERLEGRISRARADHEQLIGDNRRRYDQLQEEVRRALANPKLGETGPENSRVGGERSGEGGGDRLDKNSMEEGENREFELGPPFEEDPGGRLGGASPSRTTFLLLLSSYLASCRIGRAGANFTNWSAVHPPDMFSSMELP
ncbi:hypothetical protein BVRB_6g136940 [Beta vulgaris subsp. vulgaris]|nr:hypothetical protein BVRB_6g136940 [Beta vulgaris subsp. vulgaris]